MKGYLVYQVTGLISHFPDIPVALTWLFHGAQLRHQSPQAKDIMKTKDGQCVD
jgi:hypothetical protein